MNIDIKMNSLFRFATSLFEQRRHKIMLSLIIVIDNDLILLIDSWLNNPSVLLFMYDIFKDSYILMKNFIEHPEWANV